MRGTTAKKLRRVAENVTVGKTEKETKRTYKVLKRNYKLAQKKGPVTLNPKKKKAA